jgi:two-component system, NtrC family, response regulator HydG
MHVEDLNHKELLELDPEGGVIRFAGERALLLDAVALGLLRQQIVKNFGLHAARAILTQFGFAHGWRMAEALQTEFRWNKEEWYRAGPRILTLGGFFITHPGNDDPLAQSGMTLLASYEAEQHLTHFSHADEPVCWTICGFMSGFRSFIAGKEIYVLEDHCLAQGHAACHFTGHTREEWGEKKAEDLIYYDAKHITECLDVSLAIVIKTLKASEAMLREHHQALIHVAPFVDETLGIIARSLKMRQVVELAKRIAKVDAPVLITGESGTGKERIARLVHRESSRSGGPFLAVNCGAITETLIESEFFGHVRGAFTGANADRIGLFEAANHGTLLLDEIGDISPGMQVKLLRVLQEREIRRIGENRSRSIDVRVLAATNRDLSQAITEGSFRQDLYYRLKVVELRVPTLRERKEDVLPLSRVMLAEAATRMSRKITGITSAAADQLLRYEWPGNVRELENVMERAVALASGSRIDLVDLPEEIRSTFPRPVLNEKSVRPLSAIEKEYILAVYELNGRNQVKSAKQLQIGSATLYRKLKKYGVN